MNRKELKILIAVKFYKRNNKIFQHFIYPKEYKKYLNEKYLIYYRFAKKLGDECLFGEQYLYYRKRIEEDRIVLEFEGTEKPNNYFFTLHGTVPPIEGCNYCCYKEEVNDIFFRCIFQNNKSMSRILNKCKYFRENVE